jgi:hypothetical protein
VTSFTGFSGELLQFGRRGKKGTCFCRNIVPAKRNSWKVTLGKKEHEKEFLFFAGTWK